MNVGDQVLITGGPSHHLGNAGQVKVLYHLNLVMVELNHCKERWTLDRKQVMELKGRDV